jgi:DNA-binding CsgD family transcriptional regulator
MRNLMHASCHDVHLSVGEPTSPPTPAGTAAGRGLHGRRRECEALDHLVADVRAGRSRVLVLRGAAGSGKTALLEYLVQGSAGCHIVRAAGAEPEREWAFAGLHQLCAPFMDRLGHLPGPQRDALGTAFHLRDGHPPDRFAVGVAALSLLSDAAADGPLLGLVDDAQWLDPDSGQALAFVARHLAAAPVAMVLALRQAGEEHELTGLPELPVGGLADGDAHELLDSVLIGPIDERVRNRIAADAQGNPAALLELPRMLTPAELAGGFALPAAVPLPRRVAEDYLRRLTPLPPATRLLLLVAAAELTADPVVVWRAASRLGVEAGAAAPAVAAGLIDFGGQVRFCHPFARAAIYQAASLPDRQGVHQALADVTDPIASAELRAWHRAQTTSGFDEEIAASLEHSSGRAQDLGGFAAAAAFGERAAELTPEPGRRARRALTAARTEHQAGAQDAALRLLAVAQTGPSDERRDAQADLLRAQVAAGPGRDRNAGQLLIRAAKRLEQVDAGLAREALRDAFTAALAAGRLGSSGGIRQVAGVALAAPPASRPLPASDLLLEGLALLIADGPAAGTPLVQRAVRAFCQQESPARQALSWLPLACRLSRTAWDDESWDVLSARLIEVARRTGGLTALPNALLEGAAVRLAAGEPAMAAALIAEAEAAARATGNPVGPYGPVMLAAWAGREADVTRLITARTPEMAARGEGQWLTAAAWASAVLHNGLGHYDRALAAAEQGSEYPAELGVATWSLAELIEAAVRTGAAERAAEALRRLCEATSAAVTDWALGLQARSRALVADDETAERLYLEAIERLGRTRLRAELSRAHLLYGEWLRRKNRRVNAREQLRIAYTMLTAVGAEGFAERARHELEAAGENVRKRMIEKTDGLTAQETQIAQLAVHGHTNPEISTQLFISPRTVEWHLRKVFTKLGISSRKELRVALSNLERVPRAGVALPAAAFTAGR